MNGPTPSPRPDSTLLPGVGLWALLALAWLVYVPGLSGAFLFDDWANLPALGAHGPIDTWPRLITYLLSGIASSTGRPVAMLSFLLDANNWPAAAEPFKHTNVLIHLLNGALLTWLSFRLSRLLSANEKRAAWVAVASSTLWLLHPLMVSTTLFVVQRMAMLAATFVLAGMLCYLHGRTRLAANHTVSGYLWMSIGAAGCGILATLSKENGALLPLFLLITESVVIQRQDSPLHLTPLPRGWRLWQGAFIYLPLCALAAYLLGQFPAMLHAYAGVRDFTLVERLLTEGRVVARYIYLLLIPHGSTAGLYNDDIAVSTGLLHPWTTLPALGLLGGLLALGWKLRKTQPAVGLAVLFYLAGQLLESTVIPLELYYEHRNYLPSVFLFFPLALWLVTKAEIDSRWWLLIAPALALLASLTWMRADLWGRPFEQAAVWARQHPDSPRAQTTFALQLMHRQQYRQAIQVLERAGRRHPDDIMIGLNLLSARCAVGGVRPEQFDAVKRALARAKVGNQVASHAISQFIRYHDGKGCPGLGQEQLKALIQSALDNPQSRKSSSWRQDMLSLQGEVQLAQHRPVAALELFKNAVAAQPRPDAALREAALLGSAGHAAEGLALLDYYAALPKPPAKGVNVERLLAIWLRHTNYYPRETARLRAILTEDADNNGDRANSHATIAPRPEAPSK